MCAQIGNDLLDCRYLHTEVRDFESRYPPLTGAIEPSADAAGPKTERSGRETTRPTGTAKEKFRDYAKGVIDRAQAENTKLPTRANLLRLSKVNETPGFPFRASTLYKWVHLKKHPELFVRLGGAVYVNLDKLDSIIQKGGMK